MTEAHNVLERELEKQVRDAQATEADMQKLRKDLDRLTTVRAFARADADVRVRLFGPWLAVGSKGPRTCRFR